MVHSLTTTPAAAIPILTKPNHTTTHNVSSVACPSIVHRRTLAMGIAGALFGLNVGSANAAKRPPPPPPTEKKDPNVSGVQAKVLASKKRKEALKEAAAKMREKGKPVAQ